MGLLERRGNGESEARAEGQRRQAGEGTGTKEVTEGEGREKGRAKSAKKPKAHRAATNGESYGCGVCSETFPTMKKATAHAMTHTS